MDIPNCVSCGDPEIGGNDESCETCQDGFYAFFNFTDINNPSAVCFECQQLNCVPGSCRFGGASPDLPSELCLMLRLR